MYVKRTLIFIFGLVFLTLEAFSSNKIDVRLHINESEPEKEKNSPYKVVAHRGGYLECGLPDCSIASLKYAIGLGCYASECDIVITKDNDIIVAHPVKGYLINGLAPYEHTVAEIRARGKLANGEEVPTLRDFLNVIMDKELNPLGMKVWLDVKKLTKERQNLSLNHSIEACLRAAEIIKEMKAEEHCEFLIPTGEEFIDAVRDKIADEYKINIAWMTPTHPKNYYQAWAQLPFVSLFGENRKFQPSDYIEAGVPLSIYSVNNEERMDVVIPYYSDLKAIFTDYPKLLIEKLKQNGK